MSEERLKQLMESEYDRTKPWWDQPKDNIWGRWLKAPCTNSLCHIFVGSNPEDGMTKATASRFDVILNVADTACVTFEPYPYKRTQHYWYPVAESHDWTYGAFYKVFKTLDHHTKQGHVIYHHCHAGEHRSAITMLYYLMYKGFTRDEAYDMLDKQARPDLLKWEHQDWLGKHLPTKLDDFCKLLAAKPRLSLGDALHEIKLVRWGA